MESDREFAIRLIEEDKLSPKVLAALHEFVATCPDIESKKKDRTIQEILYVETEPIIRRQEKGKFIYSESDRFHEIVNDIRNRDHRNCQICQVNEIFLGRTLDVHHIDHDRRNNNQSNLISLCRDCHALTWSDNPPIILPAFRFFGKTRTNAANKDGP